MTLLNWPAGRVPAALTWEFMRPDISVSGPSGVTQHQGRTGAKWALQAQLPPVIDSSVSAAVKTVLQRCTAASVWMQAPDHSYRRQSTRYGIPAVNGGSQTGSSIALDGFPPSITDAVKAGDRLGFVFGQVVTATADADSNAAGEVTVSIDPPLRASPTDNSLVYIDQPLCIFKTLSRAGWGVTAPYQHSFSISAIEDISSGAPDADYPAWLAEQTTDETEGYVDIVRDGVLHAGMTVTRASTGYYLSKAGVLTSASTNIPRTEYDANGAVLGLLVEGARTNICLRSQELDNASWTDAAGTPTVTANSTAAPDGTTTADTITDDNAASAEAKRMTVTIANNSTAWCVSVYVKATGAPTHYPAINLRMSGGTTVDVYAVVNTETGAIVTSAAAGSVNLSGAELVNGYWRFYISANNNSTGNTSLLMTVYPAYNTSGTGTINNAATGASVFWGAQIENAAFPSSYIPATTVSVSRAADVISTTSLSALLGFSALEGSVFIEFSMQSVETSAAVSRRLLSLNNGSANERILLLVNTGQADLDLNVADGGSTVASMDGKAITARTVQKACAAWRVNDIALYADGAQQSTDTSATLPTVTTLELNELGANHGFAHIKNLRYYARRLSNAELASLTT